MSTKVTAFSYWQKCMKKSTSCQNLVTEVTN
uniref:Uncharacterized protein n=1 Tax=Anguilla anguilla TaxID=7936 RepID=A0A0E9TUH6_ANGAN